MNNGQIDCVGSTDEQDYCGNVYPLNEDDRRFRCDQSDLCLSSFDLCNQISSCPLNDDEFFCQNDPNLCHSHRHSNSSILQNIFCQY